MARAKRFLFLQGPHGPFFNSLGRRLAAEGHGVRRIHFNGGDLEDWDMPGAVSFTGGLDRWAGFLREYLLRHEITDIVFYGYWRPAHRAAIELSGKLGIQLHGFEEGLLRPHWITLDPRLPDVQAEGLKKKVEERRGADDTVALPDQPVVSNAVWWMILHCCRYYLNYFRHRKVFALYRTHRLLPPGRELQAWVLQVLKYPWRKAVSALRQNAALKDTAPYFLLCLQLDGDSQIRHYSGFSGMVEVLEKAIASFSRHAPSNARLVVKKHPLDNGTARLERRCRDLARKNGVTERVVFISFGKLAGLLKNAQGMVTVNSSTGLQALFHGCPVKTLGASVYNIPGLADAATLESFWRNPRKPDPAAYRTLHRLLAETSQHGGSFYAPECRQRLIASCLPRLTAERLVAAEDFLPRVARA